MLNHSNLLNHSKSDPNLPILFLGTKLDLKEDIMVDDDYARQYMARFNLFDYLKISSKMGKNVQEAFETLTRKIVEGKRVYKPRKTFVKKSHQKSKATKKNRQKKLKSVNRFPISFKEFKNPSVKQSQELKLIKEKELEKQVELWKQIKIIETAEELGKFWLGKMIRKVKMDIDQVVEILKY